MAEEPETVALQSTPDEVSIWSKCLSDSTNMDPLPSQPLMSVCE